MANPTGSLERYYTTAIQSKKDWGFFLGVADYFELIKELPELKPLIDKIFAERDKALEEINKIEPEAVKELQDFKKELLETIKNGKIKKEGLQKAIQRLEDLESGKINPSHYKSSRLDEGLRDLVRLLSDDENDFKKNYGYRGVSKKHFTRQLLSFKISEEKETTIWGAYIEIRNVFRVIKEYYKHLNNLKKEKTDTDAFLKLKKEMDIIEKNGDETGFNFFYSARSSEDYFSSSKDKRIRELQRDKYEIYLTRFHNYLVKELNRDEKSEALQSLNNLANENLKINPPNIVKDFEKKMEANKKAMKQWIEKAEMTEEIKNSVLTEIENSNQQEKSSKKSPEKINLHLDKRGNLCNQKGKCYEIGETSKRHKLIRFLVVNSDYQPTKLITDSIGYQNNQTTSGEIGKIRKNVKRDLNIKGRDFLEVKKDSGYRINPKYKIKIND